MNIGFIGCGDIAHFHADVLIHLGHKISCVSSRPNSNNIKIFQKKYSIESVYSDWEEMLNQEYVDAIWVVTGWSNIDEILLKVLSYNTPVFFEKPVALSVEKIESAIKNYPHMLNKVQIGYNRRFYDFIPYIKNKLTNIEIKSIEVNIPESAAWIKDELLIKNLFLQNSSHVIDLLYYLLNEPKIKVDYIYRNCTNNKLPGGYNALMSINQTIPIHLISNWESPSNFGIRFHSNNLLIELLPIEIATIYEGFQIIEPTTNNPIRRYKPQIKEQLFMDSDSAKFKPGFLKQTNNFLDTCVEAKYINTIGSNLISALEMTQICKEVM